MLRRNKWTQFATILCLIVLISGCIAPLSPEHVPFPAPATPDEVATPLPDEEIPETLIFAHAGYPATTLIDRALYQTLVRHQPDGSIGPDLAEAWEISDDFTVVTFSLNPNARFSSGEAVTSADAEAAIQRVQESAGPLTESIESIEIIDDSTLRLNLNRPDVEILSKLAVEAFGVQNAEGLGSGPYQVEQREGEDWVLTQNPHYQDTENRPQRLIFRFVPNSQVQAALLMAGEINAAFNLAPMDASDIQAAEAENLWALGGVDTKIVSFMPNLRSFQEEVDINLLQEGLRYAIDKEAIRATYAPDSVIPTSIVPFQFADVPVFDQQTGYDPERARELLVAANFDFERSYELGFIPRNTSTYDGLSNEMLAQAIQDNLEVLGIESIPVPLAPQEFEAREAAGDPIEFLLLDRRPLYPNATASLDYLPGGTVADLISFDDPELADLAEALQYVTSEDERTELLGSIQEILADRGPYNPLLQPSIYLGYDAAAGTYLATNSSGLRSSSAYARIAFSLDDCRRACQHNCASLKCKVCSYLHDSINHC